MLGGIVGGIVGGIGLGGKETLSHRAQCHQDTAPHPAKRNKKALDAPESVGSGFFASELVGTGFLAFESAGSGFFALD